MPQFDLDDFDFCLGSYDDYMEGGEDLDSYRTFIFHLKPQYKDFIATTFCKIDQRERLNLYEWTCCHQHNLELLDDALITIERGYFVCKLLCKDELQYGPFFEIQPDCNVVSVHTAQLYRVAVCKRVACMNAVLEGFLYVPCMQLVPFFCVDCLVFNMTCANHVD